MTGPTLSAAELAVRGRRQHRVRLDEQLAARWREQGVVEQPEPGRWRLTRSGRAMFAGWMLALDDEGIAA